MNITLPINSEENNNYLSPAIQAVLIGSISCIAAYCIQKLCTLRRNEPSTTQTNFASFPLKSRMFSEQRRAATIHYDIAHQNRAKIEGWFSSLNHENISMIDQKDERFGLSPLAVAIMVRDVTTVKKLLALGANCKCQDVHGWTPLHYAMLLGDKTLKAELMTVSATHGLGLETIKNRASQTARELFLRTQVTVANESQTVVNYRNEKGSIQSLTANQFKDLTGASFSERIICTPQGLIEDWLDAAYFKSDPMQSEFQKAFDAKYQSVFHDKLAACPKLLLAKHNRPEVGFDVIADEKIPAGAIVTPYVGLMDGADYSDPQNHDLSYLDRNVNGKRVRNLGPIVIDSYPNCVMHSLSYADGLSQLTLIIALKTIKQGERLTVDYGCNHSVKGEHFELNTDELEASLKAKEYKKLLNKGKHLSPEIFFRNISPGTYLLSTPSAILHGLLKGCVSLNEMRQFCQNVPEFHTLSIFNKNAIGNIFEMYEQFSLCLEKHKKSKRLIKSRLLEINHSFPLMTTLQVMEFVYTSLSEKRSPNEIERLTQQCKKVATTAKHLQTLITEGKQRGGFTKSTLNLYIHSANAIDEPFKTIMLARGLEMIELVEKL